MASSTSKRTSFKSKRHVSLVRCVSLFYKSQRLFYWGSLGPRKAQLMSPKRRNGSRDGFVNLEISLNSLASFGSLAPSALALLFCFSLIRLSLSIVTTWSKQYHMDKTRPFFRLLPRYTLLVSFENVSSTGGTKKSKEQVSLVVCANATGTHEIPCTLIGKPKSTSCIKNRAWPLKYISQNKAWMSVAPCWKWFENVFYPEVRKRTRRPVLLLLNNAPGHLPISKNEI